jgi:CxxC-x17-CxxC domain-containing protein
MKKSKAKAPKVDPFVEGLMGKLLERLTNLEHKMDKVLSQTAKSGPAGAGHQPQQPQQQQQPPRPKERQMYEAICANCAKVCEVPFRPSENRAVYCKVCFAQKKGQPHGMPILRPVAVPPKPVGDLGKPLKSPAPEVPPKKAKAKPRKASKKKK